MLPAFVDGEHDVVGVFGLTRDEDDARVVLPVPHRPLKQGLVIA